MERRLFVFAASAFIVAAVLGSAWMTGQFTTPAVDRTDGYVGELAARDQPWTRLFRVSDVLAGLACLLGVTLVPRVAREWPGWLALAAFGLLTVVTGLFPLDCATVSDPLCGRQGTSMGHLIHLAAGGLGTAAVLAAMALLGVSWRSWVSWLFTWLTLAATVLTVAGLAGGRGAGLAHRAQLTMIAFWLVYVALRLLIADDQEGNEALTPSMRIAPGRMGGVGGARVRPEGAGEGFGVVSGAGHPLEAVSGADAGRLAGTAEEWCRADTAGGGGEEGGDGVAGRGVEASPGGGGAGGAGVGVGLGGGGAGGAGVGVGSGGVVVGCGRQHVVVQGEGPAVLIAVGAAGAWFHWDAVAGLLVAAGHRVIRFDRPGLGLSPPSSAPPTLYGEVARLAALAPAHPQQVTVIAHGVACWHAEAFARLHPLCLARLVLVDPACVTERPPPAAATGTAGRWLPALGGTWGATVLARLTGPAAHRLLTGLPDPSGISRTGTTISAMAGEWLARGGMAADLRRLRAEKPFPGAPVVVISAGDPDGCRERLAYELGGEHVRVPGPGRRIHLHHPHTVADAALPSVHAHAQHQRQVPQMPQAPEFGAGPTGKPATGDDPPAGGDQRDSGGP
ncbi:alpha/beta fold hydrolase [Nonomuraea fuscirosea]|uniref:alpha/beta fold hydrolase n=1 Tax=Nonomuraea fuscirosea TaxID=1291556 RepID=UPI0033F8275E